jgi:hypothetical protein
VSLLRQFPFSVPFVQPQAIQDAYYAVWEAFHGVFLRNFEENKSSENYGLSNNAAILFLLLGSC